MSLGIRLISKTIDISAPTWSKMKMVEGGSGDDVRRIARPQTATLERPRILDVALLGKIDMSLTRKGLLSISNLCIAPLDNVQTSRDAKRNSTCNRGNRHGDKTRKCSTPRKLMDEKNRIKQLKNEYRRYGHKTDESWDDEENSASESSLRVRKVSRGITISRSPSRGSPVEQKPRDKSISPYDSISNDVGTPGRTSIQQPRKEKRVSPVSYTNSNISSPRRGSVGKPNPREVNVGSATNSPYRASVVKKVSREKRASPVSYTNSNISSPRRESVCKPKLREVNVGSATNSPYTASVMKKVSREKRVSPVSCTDSNISSPRRDPVCKPKPRETNVGSAIDSPYRASVVKNVSREKHVSPISCTNSSVTSSAIEDIAEKPSHKTCKRPVIIKKDGKNVDEVFGGPKPSEEVPEPCSTCGHPEQPERFHSHPPPSSSALRRHHDNNNNNNRDGTTRSAVTKSSVCKPVPMKYRSGRSTRSKSDAPAAASEAPALSRTQSSYPIIRNPSVGPDTTPADMQPADRKAPSSGEAARLLTLDDKGSDRPIMRTGPRTVLCYLCGRGFGTASLPLHEPHCLQRWERENSKLPTHLQRTVPEKPSTPLTVEQWNAFAWEASQASLVPCANCDRTFNPDRLAVHQRSCRPPPGQATKSNRQQDQQDTDSSSSSSGAVKVPPAVYCYICGRMFGTHSISIHETQCLDKWRKENDKLPEHQRRPEPMKPQTRLITTRTPTAPVPQHPAEAPKDAKLAGAPHVMDCYLCGREFDTRFLNEHEDECIKQWRQWNSSLPIGQRLPEPIRPEFNNGEHGLRGDDGRHLDAAPPVAGSLWHGMWKDIQSRPRRSS